MRMYRKNRRWKPRQSLCRSLPSISGNMAVNLYIRYWSLSIHKVEEYMNNIRKLSEFNYRQLILSWKHIKLNMVSKTEYTLSNLNQNESGPSKETRSILNRHDLNFSDSLTRTEFYIKILSRLKVIQTIISKECVHKKNIILMGQE